MKLIGFWVIILIISSCRAQEQNYSELKYVYTTLVEAFKSKDDQVLREFCYILAADQSTLDYMRNSTLCYRGIPCKMDEDGMDIKSIGDEFFPNLLRVRNRLISEGLLEKLVHVDSTQYKWDIVIIVNYKTIGSDKVISQEDYSLSMEKYDEAIAKAAALGKSFNELLLKDRKGDVYIIKGTEMSMHLKSGNKSIEYPIGEMVLINNKWSLFTKPKTDFYIKE